MFKKASRLAIYLLFEFLAGNKYAGLPLGALNHFVN